MDALAEIDGDTDADGLTLGDTLGETEELFPPAAPVLNEAANPPMTSPLDPTVHCGFCAVAAD